MELSILIKKGIRFLEEIGVLETKRESRFKSSYEKRIFKEKILEYISSLDTKEYIYCKNISGVDRVIVRICEEEMIIIKDIISGKPYKLMEAKYSVVHTKKRSHTKYVYILTHEDNNRDIYSQFEEYRYSLDNPIIKKNKFKRIL